MKQILQAIACAADFFGELLVFAQGGSQLLAQFLVIGAQTMAQLNNLTHFLLERFELGFHAYTIGGKIP